jgi:D-psicose/D-tagatose/L-ribulose 3-epimerase
MKIGVCGYINAKNMDGTGFDFLALAKQAGFDYVELPLSTVAALDVNEFRRVRQLVERSGMRVEACNVMYPGTLRLTGPEVDRSAVRTYLDLALGRAAILGAQVVVFGSAGARNVPEGFPLERAWMQLIEMLRLADPILEQNGLTLCIEPLNKAESNVIQTAAEGFALAKLADRPNVRLLVDYYHMARDGEDCGIIRTAGDMVQHAHFADPDGRVYPSVSKPRFQDFFGALKDIHYNGRVSLEAAYQNFESEASQAQEIMRVMAS